MYLVLIFKKQMLLDVFLQLALFPQLNSLEEISIPELLHFLKNLLV